MKSMLYKSALTFFIAGPNPTNLTFFKTLFLVLTYKRDSVGAKTLFLVFKYKRGSVGAKK